MNALPFIKHKSLRLCAPIYLRLAGGLGNQLFQAAAATLVSSTLDRSIVISISGLAGYHVPRKFYLRSLIGTTSCISYVVSCTPSVVDLALNQIRLGRISPIFSINDRNIQQLFHSRLFMPLFMDGYFQDFWTWPLFKCALSQLSLPPCSFVDNRIEGDEILVHIRGGDFLDDKNLHVADLAYYKRAISDSSVLGLNRYAFVSDDQKYLQYVISELAEYFPELSFRAMSATGVLDDFNLIRSAKYKIIGNSTFAWWASALSVKSSHTWSTALLARGKPKNFLLPWETAL